MQGRWSGGARMAGGLCAVLLGACGSAPASGGTATGGAAAQTGTYQAPVGAGVQAQDQDQLPFALGKLLQGTVPVASLHLPTAAASRDIAFQATAVTQSPDLNPALTDPAWQKAGGFCLPAADGAFTEIRNHGRRRWWPRSRAAPFAPAAHG